MFESDTLVFPTDFSPCSEQAFDYAVFLAQHHGAPLHILHATLLHADDPADPERHFPEEEALLEKLEEVSQSRLNQLVDQDLVSTLRVREVKRRGFNAAEEILAYAHGVQAGAIIMGTHGRRGPSRWFLGSVAEDVLRRAECPVLVVREREERKELTPIGKILAPVDFSRNSQSAVQDAAALAKEYKAHLDLLHVIDLPVMPSVYGQPVMADFSQLEDRAGDELRRFAAESGLEEGSYSVTIDRGWAPAAIVDHAATKDCGLIVLPAHSRRRGGLLGSTTELVIRRASCPVLALPSAQNQPDADS